MQEIESALKLFTISKRATYQKTSEDAVILSIARAKGLTSESIPELINEKHKRLKGKTVCAKYLLTALIPNLQELQDKVTAEQPKETRKLMIG